MVILSAGRFKMRGLTQPKLISNSSEGSDNSQMSSAEIPAKNSKKKGILQRKWQLTSSITSTSSTLSSTSSRGKSTNSMKPQKKSIAFHETVRVRPTLHVDDMTNEEYFNAWYSDEEMIMMKKNMARDFKCFLKVQQTNDKQKLIKQKMGMRKKSLPTKSSSFSLKFGRNKDKNNTNNNSDDASAASNESEESTNSNSNSSNIDYYHDNELVFTLRGMEYRTKKGCESRRRNKYTATHAVLNEQELQTVCGSFDDEAIRSVYQSHGSERCAIAANKLGMQDAKDAMTIHNEQPHQAQKQTPNKKGAGVSLNTKKHLEEDEESRDERSDDGSATVLMSNSTATPELSSIQEQEKTKEENGGGDDGTGLLIFNQLYIQTFHKKRKVIEELEDLIAELEKQEVERQEEESEHSEQSSQDWEKQELEKELLKQQEKYSKQ